MSRPQEWDRAMAVYALPVEPYIGLPLADAAVLAAREGCSPEDVSSLIVLAADFVPQRVSVVLDEDGRVTAATRG